MSAWVKDRLPLFAVLIVFIVLKWPHLSYPFFWDESWPYAKAVHAMYDNGPGLLPGTIDGELSRGHPLMFHFLTACWMTLFGTGRVAMHSFPLFISVLFLAAIYNAALRFFSRNAAVTAVLLVAAQQIFFVESAFVMPEVTLAFFAFLSIYYYSSKRYVLAAIAMTLLYYTKESGLIVGFILGVDAFVGLFNKHINRKEKLMAIGSVIFPLLMIGLFFILQKMINGWYVLPMYSNSLETLWREYYLKFRNCGILYFRDDERRLWFFLLLLVSTVAAIRFRKKGYAALWLCAPLIAELASDHYHWIISSYALVPAAVIAMLVATYQVCKAAGFNESQRRYLLLNMFLAVVFMLFTPLSLLIYRYLIIGLVPLLFVSAVFFSHLVDKMSKRYFVPSLALLLLITLIPYSRERKISDISMGAFDAMEVQQKAVLFLEDHRYYNRHIVINQFLQWQHLLDEQTGFKRDTTAFENVTWEKTDRSEVLLFDNIESNMDTLGLYKAVKNGNFHCVYRAERGPARSEIYERNRQ